MDELDGLETVFGGRAGSGNFTRGAEESYGYGAAEEAVRFLLSANGRVRTGTPDQERPNGAGFAWLTWCARSATADFVFVTESG